MSLSTQAGKSPVVMKGKSQTPAGLLHINDLNLDPKSFNISLGERLIEITGPTCTICSECCLCETGGV